MHSVLSLKLNRVWQRRPALPPGRRSPHLHAGTHAETVLPPPRASPEAAGRSRGATLHLQPPRWTASRGATLCLRPRRWADCSALLNGVTWGHSHLLRGGCAGASLPGRPQALPPLRSRLTLPPRRRRTVPSQSSRADAVTRSQSSSLWQNKFAWFIPAQVR
jgi:hypothetical protein